MEEQCAIVIPTYNEKGNLKDLVHEIKRRHPAISILIIDDNSPDGTAQLAERLSKKYSSVDFIRRNKRYGVESAHLFAFKKILSNDDFECLITMDAGFTHDPRDIKILLKTIESGNDLVVGSRFVKGATVSGWNLKRRLSNHAFGLYSKTIARIPVTDVTARFVGYRRNVLEDIVSEKVKSKGDHFQTEIKYLAHQSGASIAEVPINFTERSGLTEKDGMRMMKDALVPWKLALFERR